MPDSPPSPPPVITHPEIPEPDLPLLHDRIYQVRSYKRSDTELLVRGQVRDQKPAGMYFDDDPDPMTIHHMILDLVVGFPHMTITEASLVMQTYPQPQCRAIEEDYGRLVGVSIARGFSHKVRELFGGPRGCTHTNALLNAMAPVAIQSVWSMIATADDVPTLTPLPPNPSDEELRAHFAFTLNTCHVWDEDGEVIESARQGVPVEAPLWLKERAGELGTEVGSWPPRRRRDAD